MILFVESAQRPIWSVPCWCYRTAYHLFSYCHSRLFRGVPVGECPLWVKSRHLQCKTPCPLYPPKADIRAAPASSYKCPNNQHCRMSNNGGRLLSICEHGTWRLVRYRTSFPLCRIVRLRVGSSNQQFVGRSRCQ